MADLIWECIRKNNCFLRPDTRVTLSAENGNMYSKNSFKYSGLTGKAAGLKLVQAGKKSSIVMTAPSRKIAASTTVSKNNAAAFKTISKVLGATRPAAVAPIKRAYAKIKQALRN